MPDVPFFYNPNAVIDLTRPTIPAAQLYNAKTLEYLARSGAVRRKGYINLFFDWLAQQGLWAHTWMCLLESAANKGSGATAFAAGGLREGAFAARQGTFSANPANNDTVTIGATTYTFKSALTSGGATANEVLIGTDLSGSRNNLIAAVTAGTGAGIYYGSATAANASATAAAYTTNVITATALTAGVAGNSIPLAKSSSAFSWASAATTLTGGVEPATDMTLTGAPVWAANGLVWANLKSGQAVIPGLKASTRMITFRRGTVAVAVGANAPEGTVISMGSTGTSGGGEGKGFTLGGSTGVWLTEAITVFVNTPPVTAPIVASTQLVRAAGSTDTIVTRTGINGVVQFWKNNTPFAADLTNGFTAGTSNMSPSGAGFTTNDIWYFHGKMQNGGVVSSSDSPTWQFIMMIDESLAALTDAQIFAINAFIDNICET
ncbi:MAG: hypothetical protein V4726_00820 [Verrucomicrobiota bacterium]